MLFMNSLLHIFDIFMIEDRYYEGTFSMLYNLHDQTNQTHEIRFSPAFHRRGLNIFWNLGPLQGLYKTKLNSTWRVPKTMFIPPQ